VGTLGNTHDFASKFRSRKSEVRSEILILTPGF
jgi:hypothetical protein